MNVSKHISHYKDSFDHQFEQYFNQLNNKLSYPKASEYSKKCVELIRELSLTGGKRQRVAYLHEAFKLHRNAKISSKVKGYLEACSISIELLQTHLLIHDDIIDNSPTRRGVATTLNQLKKMLRLSNNIPLGMAIITGDIAAYLAIQVLLDSNIPKDQLNKIAKIQTQAGLDTFIGQIFDLERDIKGTIFSEDTLIELADFKAARSSTLAPMLIGISLSSQDTLENVERITRYATNVGIAGQIQDDYLGMFGDPLNTGKSNVSDLQEGKRTLLITKALEVCTKTEDAIISRSLGDPNISTEQANKIKMIIKKYSVDIKVKGIAEFYAKQASAEARSWSNWDKNSVEFFAESAEWFITRSI